MAIFSVLDEIFKLDLIEPIFIPYPLPELILFLKIRDTKALLKMTMLWLPDERIVFS